jgi:hypothetical protein
VATVRAKFKCTEERRAEGKFRSFKFSPVYSNEPDSENKAFWDATPQGSLELGITNDAAWPLFTVGQEYYLDFTPAA